MKPGDMVTASNTVTLWTTFAQHTLTNKLVAVGELLLVLASVEMSKSRYDGMHLVLSSANLLGWLEFEHLQEVK